MELLDNINRLLGDDLKQALKPGVRLKVAASCFSMYAYEALKAELQKIDGLDFIFTAPTFTASEVTDPIRKERREFHIPKLDRERSLYGSEFEIQLRNKLTQKAIAKECADWIRSKAKFMSNHTQSPMQQFACVQGGAADTAYMPLHGFTAVDLGYQPGNAVSNLVNKMDEPAFTATYLSLFDQIWQDPQKLQDVTALICEHIDSVYQENSPESNFDKQEFKALWNRINRKAAYSVHFDSAELVHKAIAAINDKHNGLRVMPLQYTIQRGEQVEQITADGLHGGNAFVLKATQVENNKTSVHSAVKYDLIGKLAEATVLTRRTIADSFGKLMEIVQR